MRQRVAVIGAGAVGSYYGARLAEAGHEVHFLMRRDYDSVAGHGLHIESPHGAIHIEHPHVHRDPSTIGLVDWVVCALKATAIDEARELILPCIGEGTRILALMNGLGIEDRLADWFGAPRIFGGLAFTCINRYEGGRVHHLDYGEVVLGHVLDEPEALEAVAALWEGARVEVRTTPSLLAGRWTKLCWNIPFNGLAVTCGAITTDVIMETPQLRAEAEALMREIIGVANADLAVRWQAERLLEGPLIEDMMARTESMAVYRPSTMIDFVERRPMEVDAIFGEPVRRAALLEISVPRMTLLHAQMQALDAHGRHAAG